MYKNKIKQTSKQTNKTHKQANKQMQLVRDLTHIKVPLLASLEKFKTDKEIEHNCRHR